MRIILTLLLLTFFSFAWGQQLSVSDSANYTIKHYTFEDTLNVHGTVTFPNGKPVPNAMVYSTKRFDWRYHDLPIAHSDSTGVYRLTYVQPNDTLYISFLEKHIKVPVKGSRIIHAVLPESDFLTLEPVTITGRVTDPQSTRKPIELVVKKIHSDVMDFECFPHGVNAVVLGGLKAFYQLLRDQFVYPQTALQRGVEGLSKVSFAINKEGKVSDFIVHQGVGYGCEEEIWRIIKGTQWRYAIYEGKTAEQRVNLQVLFKSKP